jgi:hypothetical protein
VNYAELVQLAQDVGLTPGRAKVAAAIAMAESGGDPTKHNTKPPDNSYGLWQINMLGDLGPDRRRKYGLPNNEILFDPRRNAMVMAGESDKGGNFSKWTTYTRGTYLKFMPDDSTWNRILNGLTDSLPGARTIGEGIAGTAENVTDNIADIHKLGDAVSKTAAWVSDSRNWVRVGYVLLGGTVVLIAVAQLMKGTAAGRAAGKIGTAGKKSVSRAATSVRSMNKSNQAARAKTQARMDKDVPRVGK